MAKSGLDLDVHNYKHELVDTQLVCYRGGQDSRETCMGRR